MYLLAKTHMLNRAMELMSLMRMQAIAACACICHVQIKRAFKVMNHAHNRLQGPKQQSGLSLEARAQSDKSSPNMTMIMLQV